MPLSPSDVQYLNKLLDQHLKFQRSWPSLRFFMLGMSVFMIALGFWSRSMAMSTLVHTVDDLQSVTTRRADASSTQPVTQGELEIRLQATRSSAQMDAIMINVKSIFCLVTIMGAIFWWLFGLHFIFLTLTHWNRHRRDAILITLLREKCAAELAIPSQIPASR